MPNEKHKCPVSQEELTHDNINDFILVKVSSTEIEHAAHTHYFIDSSLQNVFFGLEKCPLTRATEEYQALYLKNLSDELKELVYGLTDNSGFNPFFANKELQNDIKTGSFKFKTVATNPATTLDEFKNLLDRYPLQMDAIIVTANNTTLLHYVARENKTEFVQALITAGVSINNTDLHEAAKNGETEKAISLITGGADINVKNSLDMSPLHYAVLGGHTETMNTLINKGADINAKDNYDRSPLGIAIWSLKFKTVLVLLYAKTKAFFSKNFVPIIIYISLVASLLLAAHLSPPLMLLLSSFSGRVYLSILTLLPILAMEAISICPKCFLSDYFTSNELEFACFTITFPSVLVCLIADWFSPSLLLFLNGPMLLCGLPVIQVAILSLLSIPFSITLLNYFDRMAPEQGEKIVSDTGKTSALGFNQLVGAETTTRIPPKIEEDPSYVADLHLNEQL
jgi:hypothetical protein